MKWFWCCQNSWLQTIFTEGDIVHIEGNFQQGVVIISDLEGEPSFPKINKKTQWIPSKCLVEPRNPLALLILKEIDKMEGLNFFVCYD